MADATEGKPQEPRSHGSCSAADSVNFNRGDFTEYSMYILCNLGALVGLGGEGLEDRAAIWGGPRLLHRGWGCGGLRSRLGISSNSTCLGAWTSSALAVWSTSMEFKLTKYRAEPRQAYASSPLIVLLSKSMDEVMQISY